MIIYLAPALLVLSLLAAASRIRHRIEPACPICSARNWRDSGTRMECASCGWATGPSAGSDAERLAA